MDARQRPTLESLAAELGVSHQTVSNVLNRPSVVAEPTRERVTAAIDAAGYVPSRAGRDLRTQRSRAIGIRLMPTFDGINGHIGDMFLHELAEHAHRSEYRLALFAAASEDEEIATTPACGLRTRSMASSPRLPPSTIPASPGW